MSFSQGGVIFICKENIMKKRTLTLIVFICSLLALLISLKLFYNMSIYADEYSTSPTAICGGSFWLGMDWLRLALLAAATFVSGARLFKE